MGRKTLWRSFSFTDTNKVNRLQSALSGLPAQGRTRDDARSMPGMPRDYQRDEGLQMPVNTDLLYEVAQAIIDSGYAELPATSDATLISVTVKDVHTLRAIYTFRQRTGYPPSYAELCSLLNVKSKSVIEYRLRTLEERGLITYEPRRARTVGLTARGKRVIA
jgi:hypothetical protein